MAIKILCIGIFRIILPLAILSSVVFRPSFLSVIYLIFFLFLPWIPSPNVTTLQGSTGIYLKLMIAISVLTALGQFAFQIVLLSMPPYGHFLETCNFLEKILRHAGFVRLNEGISLEAAFRWITPEIIMLIASIGSFIVLKKLIVNPPVEEGEATTIVDKISKKRIAFLTNIGRYPVLASVCMAGILRPSAISGLYFIVYLGVGTWWACSKSISRKLGIIFRIVAVPLVFHLFALYAVQFEYVQEFMAPHSQFERYFGLTPLILTNCTMDPRDAEWADVEYASYLNPFALLWLYYCMVLISKQLCKEKPARKQGAFSRLEGSFNGPLSRQLSNRLSDRSRLMRSANTRNRWQSATRKVRGHIRMIEQVNESTPLLRGVNPTGKSTSSLRRQHPTILQDSTGSVTVTDNQEEIQMKHLGITEEEDNPTVFEKVVFVLEAAVQVIIRSSYIVTSITMMAWSITYHSWLTFILLLWANLLWMLPNQRKSMLRSTPFLIVYAWFLLISAYIYCMDLTEDELPSVIKNINLAQIGFQKVTSLPYLHLLVKCLYTVMFWITLRQYMQERREARQSSALADMVAPLQVTVGTATGVTKDEDHGNQNLKKIGLIAYKILTKFWIWVVAITLYAVAITGTRMTAFRIVYMALFLFFVLCFQLSFRIWRKIMFAFWVVIIAFSMLILILVYTYQFDNFPDYWEEYLHISRVQQGDIGLEKYETTQLFVRLVTPTFFVIITAVQLHYFHKDFMEMSDPKNIQNNEDAQSNGSSAQGFSPLSEDSAKLDLTRISSVQLKKTFREWMKEAYIVLNYVILFLELHMPKVVLMAAAMLCIYDKCALFFLIAILVVLAFTIGKGMMTVAIYGSSIFVSLVLLARMVYQIEYIEHDMWNVTCEQDNTTYNSAEWLGFQKIAPNARMSSLVMWNVFYIIIVTLWAVINIRQAYYRSAQGHTLSRQFFMFPKVKRDDSDKNLRTFLMYLLNYGFYKFGVEICLNTTVALIGFRLDLYAFFHAIWLCILFSLRRSTLARIWNVYLIFIAILIPIQYVMVIGLPPALCIDFPWKESEMLRRLQEWAYLMDPVYGPSAKKLLCDFILLLFVSRQSVVFRIEKRHEGQEYPGGSNDIIENVDSVDFINPTPDFVTYCRSYLDVFKRGILLGFLWFTLAIVFLAGTNRVNLFSIGYLIGSFVFLWQGTDFYLRPVPKILQMWNWLLGYNVMVITAKTVLQFIGCVYITEIQSHACWLVQLLGIGCIKKFGNVALKAGIVDPNECTVPREYIGLAWDGACFGFLLLQRRIFTSYNFLHMVDDSKASAILASRGAELIEELRQKRMKEQEEHEKMVLEKIKVKMDRIKATQEKLHTKTATEPQSHSEEGIVPSSRPRFRRREPKSNKEAIRSGDYYMFDELDDDDLDIIEEPRRDYLEDEVDAEIKEATVSQLLSSALKTNITSALRRRSSMPIGRQRSSVSGRSQLSVPFSAPPRVSDEMKLKRKISIRDLKEEQEDPRPSTSKDEEFSDMVTEKEESVSLGQKIVTGLLFVWAFIESFMNSLTLQLNNYSKDYRYVRRVLTREKKLLKETTEYKKGHRSGRGQIWQPASSYHTLIKKFRAAELKREDEDSKDGTRNSDESQQKILDSDNKTVDYRRKASVLTVPEIRILAPSLEGGLDTSFCGSESKITDTYKYDYDTDEMSSVDQPAVVRLLLAIWYIILNHSDFMCYFTIFLNQIKSATFLSLPLPIMVFLWGSLTVPRPTKTFWVTIIAYTEIIVIVKCIFQFEIIPWNQSQNIHPFYPPKIIGIERKKDYAIWDLILLLIVFFHRYMLKSLGLWKTVLDQQVLTDGKYLMTEGKLEPLETQEDNTKRRHSDLEKLVEDEDDDDDDDDDDNEVAVGSNDKERVVQVRLSTVSPIDMYPSTLGITTVKYLDSTKKFFQQLIDPTSRVATDVYSYMFLCDFFNFFVILIGYSSFGTQQGDEGVSSYLEDNRVPVLFLLMLILQFMLIIIDRGIFLRKYIVGKVIFQFTQIFILHIWLFVVFPLITERSFNSVLPPQMYYMVKCFYLLLSAYQIRCGYPTRILGNFLCKGYNYLNMFLFKGFMAIPFLFELRTVMDWMWTDTSMTIFDWIKMEDIFSHIFQLKCQRYVEKEYPAARGTKRPSTVKYMMGGGILVIIIAIIWFPLVFFSLGNAVGQPNVPYDVSIDVRIGPYEPIYQMSAQANSINSFTHADYNQILNLYDKNKFAISFISNYEPADIAAVKLNTDSANIWSISPPDKKRMLEEVNSTKPVTVKLEYRVSHKSTDKQSSPVIKEQVDIVLDAMIDNKPNPVRKGILEFLEGRQDVQPVTLTYLMPKFIKVTNRNTAAAIHQLMEPIPTEKDSSFRNVSIKLSQNDAPDSKSEWWEIQEICDDFNYQYYLRDVPYSNCDFLMLYTFNDKIFPETFSFITGGGIIGLYTTLVFVASRLLRGFFSEICFRIMFDDMPYVDRILQLCYDIYLVRESSEFALEEDLFAKLVFLFRSPETLIKWTRPKEEVEDEDDPEGEADA